MWFPNTKHGQTRSTELLLCLIRARLTVEASLTAVSEQAANISSAEHPVCLTYSTMHNTEHSSSRWRVDHTIGSPLHVCNSDLLSLPFWLVFYHTVHEYSFFVAHFVCELVELIKYLIFHCCHSIRCFTYHFPALQHLFVDLFSISSELSPKQITLSKTYKSR